MKRDNLTEVTVPNFKKVMKLLAEHDLWDEMEEHLSSQGINKFQIGLEPMQAIGSQLQNKILNGTLRPKPEVLSWCGCGGGSSSGPKVNKNTGGGVMQPGTSQNDPVNQGGGNDGGTDGGTDGG